MAERVVTGNPQASCVTGRRSINGVRGNGGTDGTRTRDLLRDRQAF